MANVPLLSGNKYALPAVKVPEEIVPVLPALVKLADAVLKLIPPVAAIVAEKVLLPVKVLAPAKVCVPVDTIPGFVASAGPNVMVGPDTPAPFVCDDPEKVPTVLPVKNPDRL